MFCPPLVLSTACLIYRLFYPPAHRSVSRSFQLCLKRSAFVTSQGLLRGSWPRRWVAVGIAALLAAAGVGAWIISFGGAAPSASTAQVKELISDIETEQDSALDSAESYIAFVRERNLPGMFDYESPSWILAERFYRAHWEVSNLRATSGWFTPDLDTLSEASDWVLPATECSSQASPGGERGVDVFSLRDRVNPDVVHYVAIEDQRAYIFSPLCNFTPADRVAEARSALEEHLSMEAQARAQGPEEYFEFVKATNYPDLYDTSDSLWRLGEAVVRGLWDSHELDEPDVRDLDSIGILDLRLASGKEGCEPSRDIFPAAMWVVSTPAGGGEPFVEYFHYHEGRLSGFVALCDIQPVVNERGEISLS